MDKNHEIAQMKKSELRLNLSFYREFNPEIAGLLQTELNRREINQPLPQKIEQKQIGQMTLFETNQRINKLKNDMRH